MTADDTLLVVDDRDGVRTITIDRPAVKNALTAAMRTRFCELIEALTPTTPCARSS